MKTVLVNTADWAPPEPVPDGWVIVNAPRPLLGELTWTGEFRHGIFYAAGPVPGGWDPGQVNRWGADDAWLIEFITNDQIRQRVAVYAADYGYASIEAMEADAITLEEAAATLDLPWHE